MLSTRVQIWYAPNRVRDLLSQRNWQNDILLDILMLLRSWFTPERKLSKIGFEMLNRKDMMDVWFWLFLWFWRNPHHWNGIWWKLVNAHYHQILQVETRQDSRFGSHYFSTLVRILPLHVACVTVHVDSKNYFFKFSRNSEANA